jgi:hypothetical protein
LLYNQRMRVILLILLSFLLASGAFAGKVKKGYMALEIYNYFEAKRLFEKAMKKETMAASYGLSVIYHRADNPFYDLDSAYANIVRAYGSFPAVNEKKRIRYAAFGIDSLAIVNQREIISGQLFERARNEKTVAALQQFIEMNFWSSHIDSAVYLRDELAFEIADNAGTSEAYHQFVETYPTSYFSDQARSRYDKALYLESTASNTLTAYAEFIRKYPESPYRTDAEDQVFAIFTKTGSVESYEKFIENFPANHNVDMAWRKLYNAHMQNIPYNDGNIAEFVSEFPDYPYKDELEIEMTLAGTSFYPVKQGSKWGYINEWGQMVIPPKYEDAEDFHEGLAMVKSDGKYGYVNKSGKLVIDTDFDDALPFNEGHAVVEQRGKLGMINRNGEFIIPPRYEDLGNLENGLAYFLKDSLYGYFDAKGIERLKPKYTSAEDFEDGRAIVSMDHHYGLIDIFGTTFIPVKYDGLKRYKDDVYLAKHNDYWGLISIKGDTILPFEYAYIGPLQDNRALVEKNGQFNYITPGGKLLLTTWINSYSEFKQLAAFRNGYAKIMVDGKYNLVDTSGMRLFAKPKEGLGDYSSLIANVKAGKWGYINPAGVQVIPFSFTTANSFHGNYAIAGNDPFLGLINKTGLYAVQPFYEELSFLNDTLLIAKSLGNYGVLNVNGDTLLNFVYLSIEPINGKIVRIEQGDQLFYYDLERKKFLRKENE